MGTVIDALIIVCAAAVTDQSAHLTTDQRSLVGGYLLPDGRVDPREASEAAAHLARLGGPRLSVTIPSFGG